MNKFGSVKEYQVTKRTIYSTMSFVPNYILKMHFGRREIARMKAYKFPTVFYSDIIRDSSPSKCLP